MSHTGIVFSNRYLAHDTGPHHPERPDRLRAIDERMRGTGLDGRLRHLAPRAADLDAILTVHEREYGERFRRACESGAPVLDTADCPISSASYDTAILAAGGALTAVDAVMTGEIRHAFVACRPPGHHAEAGRAMGFCFFNNIAIAAEHLRRRHGLDRVAIIDWDVHHGNGTQHHFEADPAVFVASIHQHPDTLYPGTGYAWEKGREAGLGTTLNVPMLPRSGDDDYRRAFAEIILPAVADFQPEFVLVSAGFDAHQADPLAHILLTTEAFAWMTAEVKNLAENHCDGRLVSILEGGYDLTALADCAQAHVEALLVG